MKLPHRRAKPAPKSPEPATTTPAAPVLLVLISSSTGLPDTEFNAQREKLRRVASFDSDTRTWYRRLHLDQPEQAAEALTTLFDIARVHGPVIRVQAQPAGGGDPAGQAP